MVTPQVTNPRVTAPVTLLFSNLVRRLPKRSDQSLAIQTKSPISQVVVDIRIHRAPNLLWLRQRLSIPAPRHFACGHEPIRQGERNEKYFLESILLD
ncbi:hypothetical protein BXT84_16055 [Sulfobacillus thermotolerans]|uniref:Uncharacterized protein n=1 Tax=Sulfobacillus thermotolerans TaxID=338644 RepID=A0ABN5H4I4_9FIRM|nr:hypothetical protein BXT84_16055 [Sulfobacillus thermotolerans]